MGVLGRLVKSAFGIKTLGSTKSSTKSDLEGYSAELAQATPPAEERAPTVATAYLAPTPAVVTANVTRQRQASPVPVECVAGAAATEAAAMEAVGAETGMDSLHRDPSGALEAVRPAVTQVSNDVTAADQQSSEVRRVCLNCKSFPAPGDKLRYCGRCQVTVYCSKQCAQTHWAEHKLMCKSTRKDREESLAMHVARGGQEKDLNEANRDHSKWFHEVPGLTNEIQLLAWTHRSDAPFISAVASQGDADGSGVRVEMIPRRIWEEDPHFLDRSYPRNCRAWLQRRFSASSSFTNTEYASRCLMVDQDGVPQLADFCAHAFDNVIIHGVEIVEALTAGTRAKDLANALVWFKSMFPSQAALMVQIVLDRAQTLHGSSLLLGMDIASDDAGSPFDPLLLVPIPTRAINTEAAYMLMHGMNLEFDICLTGLRSAAHMNGREGVVRDFHPTDDERLSVRLNDGRYVNVKAANLVHIRRGEYKRRSPGP